MPIEANKEQEGGSIRIEGALSLIEYLPSKNQSIQRHEPHCFVKFGNFGFQIRTLVGQEPEFADVARLVAARIVIAKFGYFQTTNFYKVSNLILNVLLKIRLSGEWVQLEQYNFGII